MLLCEVRRVSQGRSARDFLSLANGAFRRYPSYRLWRGTTLSQRLARWFWFSFVFALTPLMLMLLIRFLGDKLSIQDVADSPELLFFSLMLSATSVGDAIENGKLNKSEALFTNMW